MKHKIAALDKLPLLDESIEAISNLAGQRITIPEDEEITEEELIVRTGEADAVLLSTNPQVRITSSYLESCPTVKYVGICGTSTAHIDLEALRERGFEYSNVLDYGDEPTAEYIFMQLTALARGVGQYKWQDVPHELMGKSIGIIGLGALGKAIAHLALAYKMDTHYYSVHRKQEWEDRGMHYNELHDLLTQCQIIVISTPTNVIALGKEEFSLLKPNTILIQASIGTPIDKDAFFDWIKKDGNYAIFDYGVGEDNYEHYKDIPRVIISKTTSGYTYESRRRLGDRVLENLKTYFDNAK